MTNKEHQAFPAGEGRLATFLRENGLSLAAFVLFAGSAVGQIVAGRLAYNEDAREHGAAALGLSEYLRSGHFVEAIFENWESEFLQLAMFVVLTKFLRQKGSSESKKIQEHEDVDDDPRLHAREPGVPWPVKRGGLVLALYERSLSIALFVLFAATFLLHAYGGARMHNEEAARHGGDLVTTWSFMATSQFWFESFQNWQSEFLSVFALVLSSIVLRERGSPQSKPVHASHGDTGE